MPQYSVHPCGDEAVKRRVLRISTLLPHQFFGLLPRRKTVQVNQPLGLVPDRTSIRNTLW